VAAFSEEEVDGQPPLPDVPAIGPTVFPDTLSSSTHAYVLEKFRQRLRKLQQPPAAVNAATPAMGFAPAVPTTVPMTPGSALGTTAGAEVPPPASGKATASPTQVPWDSPLDVPGAAWPGPTPELSNAQWPNGRQPQGLDAWPVNDINEPTPCWETSVLEDVADGWPGQCSGLKATPASGYEECKTACKNNPWCSVWTFSAELGCQCGQDVHFCDVPHGHFAGQPLVTLVGGQRIQHGFVRVMKNLAGLQVSNLENLGPLPVNGSDHCRRWCYSALDCEYWTYGLGGCWVNVPSIKQVEYPLTMGPNGAQNSGQLAGNVVAGEYIQHFCPPHGDVPGASVEAARRPRPESSPSSFFFSWQFVPYIIAAGLFLALFCCLLCIACDAGTQRKMRGLKEQSQDDTEDEREDDGKSRRSWHFQPLMEESMVVESEESEEAEELEAAQRQGRIYEEMKFKAVEAEQQGLPRVQTSRMATASGLLRAPPYEQQVSVATAPTIVTVK